MRLRDYVILLLLAGGLWVKEAAYDRPWVVMAQDEDGSCLSQTCGDIEVRYPFVLSGRSACPSFNATAFGLDCGSDGVLRINLTTDDVGVPKSWQVLGITEDSLFVNITEQRSIATCGAKPSTGNVETLALPDFPSPYLIAGDNEFVSFGCTIAVLIALNYLNDSLVVNIGGCASPCALSSDVAISPNPACGNRTCCVSAFPTTTEPIRGAIYQVETLNVSSPTPCSNVNSTFCTAFSPNFTDFSAGSFALKLSWALPDARLFPPVSGVRLNNDSSQNTSFFSACSSHSSATVVDLLPGYHCSCLPGFEGDGYAAGRGCQDIDECRLAEDDCVDQSTCNNINGSYVCRCNAAWHVGDGRRGGSGCKLSSTLIKLVASIGGIAAFAILLLALICMNIALDKRRKRNFFLQNGGAQLQQYLSAAGTTRETMKFFVAEELKAATQNFSDHLKLGSGGFGTVYMGTLKDGRVVAVKKANRGDADNQQFINELMILTQINHRHIVRLLGCCLETSTPLLVYEFVSNGDLAQNLASETPMKWDKRLLIAIQTAEALAYLHAAASPPILHRDVKAANILLDNKLDAKLADFGVSRLVPDGQEHVTTAVQGTIGYLDPEYFQTLQLTDRSDVYSLGVVMVELLTGLKPVDNRERETRFANLAMLFIDTVREKRIEELIDARLEDVKLAQDASLGQRASILAMVRLARRCLSLNGADRPSMRQVVDELHRIAKEPQGPDGLGRLDDDESEPLLPLDT